MDAILQFAQDLENLLIALGASVVVISVLLLGFMYMGSSWPLISDWKQNNPKAFTNVTIGLIFFILGSGGGILALVGQ